jgi:hypothetical protein
LFHVPAAVVCAFGLLASAGCASSDTKYVPSSSSARKALETALTAWQNGQAPGRIDSVSPAVQVVDSKWKSGQKLESFEILDEEDAEGPRWFSVQLKIQNASKSEAVRYAVLGVDPLWVYREEDHQRLSGM